MHGKGKYTYSTGKVYDGMWAEDRPVMFFFLGGKYTYSTARCMTTCGPRIAL